MGLIKSAMYSGAGIYAVKKISDTVQNNHNNNQQQPQGYNPNYQQQGGCNGGCCQNHHQQQQQPQGHFHQNRNMNDQYYNPSMDNNNRGFSNVEQSYGQKQLPNAPQQGLPMYTEEQTSFGRTEKQYEKKH